MNKQDKRCMFCMSSGLQKDNSVNINMTSNDILLVLAGSVSGFKLGCGPKIITMSM